MFGNKGILDISDLVVHLGGWQRKGHVGTHKGGWLRKDGEGLLVSLGPCLRDLGAGEQSGSNVLVL